MGTRKERVLLELEDHFTREMQAAAGATALLKRELNSLSGTSVSTSRDSDRVKESTKGVGDETEKTSKKTREYTLEMAKADEQARRLRKSLQDQARTELDLADGVDRKNDSLRNGTKDIDRYSGRLRLWAEAGALIGPGAIPIGAAAIPALAGLTAGLGAAAGAAGVAVLAFHGVGDALKALQVAELEPTTANLQKARASLDELGPAGAQFARYLQSLRPALKELQNTAREGLFPGLQDGIENLMPLLPQVERIIGRIAHEMGDLASGAGTALGGARFSDFFNYLETDAAPILHSFAVSTGNVIEALGHLVVAFAPMTRDFTGGMERMTASFAHWADGLSRTQGFQDFVDYVHQSGPQVVSLLGALGNALVGIIRAAAPFGAVVVPALTAMANVLAAIANSPIGPPLFTAAAAMLALNRAALLTTAAFDRLTVSSAAAGRSVSTFGAGGAGIIAVIGSADILQNAFDKLANTNITSGNLGRSLEALSRGKTVDDLGNLFNTFSNVQEGWVPKVNPLSWISSWDPSGAESAAKSIKAIDEALAQMVEGGDAKTAAAAFANLVPTAKKAGLSVAEMKALFPQYATAVDNAAAATDRYDASTAGAGQEAHKTATRIRGLVAAMEENRSTALSTFDAVTQYGNALAAARKQAKSSDAGINASTAAGRKNRDALSQLAAAWNNQGDAIRNNVGKWREARTNFVQTAVAMGMPIGKARELANRLLEIPKQRLIEVRASTEAAKKGLVDLKGALDAIQSKTIFVTTIRKGTSVVEPHASITRASGGPIFGPGTKTSDSVPVMASNGEFMMSAAAVDYYGLSTMFAMNARRLADGGPVDPKKAAKEAKAQAAAVRSAKHDFNLHGGMDPREVRHALHAFAQDLHKAGFVVGAAFGHLSARSILLAGRIEAETKARDNLKQRRSDLVSTASGVFTHDAFGGSLSDLTTQLEADTNDYAHGQRALAKAKRRGLSGPLAEELAKSGNLALIDQIARSTPARIHQLEQMLQARGAQASGFAHAAVDASGLQRQIDNQNALIKKQTQVLDRLEHAVEEGAHRGTKAGAEGREKRRNRDSANRGRSGR